MNRRFVLSVAKNFIISNVFLFFSGGGALLVLAIEWLVRKASLIFDVILPDFFPVVVCFVVMCTFAYAIYLATEELMSDEIKKMEDLKSSEVKKAVDAAHNQELIALESQKAVKRRENELNAYIQSQCRKVELREEELQKRIQDFEHLLEEKKQSYPWLSKHISEMYYKDDTHIAYQLAHKKRAALSASKQVQEISKEKRLLMQNVKMLEYQLEFYENAFPWLHEFKETPPLEAWQYTKDFSSNVSEHEYFQGWLSPQEYSSLSPSERLQQKLERYKKRKKTLWDVGIEYERYIGYTYEISGAIVRYHGVQMKKEDMGRDLIVTFPDRVLVVQCKRWAQEKTLHENSIFQLYGTTILLGIQNPSQKFEGVFVTTSTLSDLAKQCADVLKIQVKEHIPFEDYPCIKCNIGKDGDKIFHLPFDLQYDRLHITPSKGDCYVHTVAEAESLGFRHAYKWSGTIN